MRSSFDRMVRAMQPVAERLITPESVQRQRRLDWAIARDGQIEPQALRHQRVPQAVSWFIAGTLAVANEQGMRWRAPSRGHILRIDAYAKTAPTGASLALRMGANSVLIASFSIAAGQQRATFLGPIPLEAGDEVTVDITQVGSGAEGANLSVHAVWLPGDVG